MGAALARKPVPVPPLAAKRPASEPARPVIAAVPAAPPTSGESVAVAVIEVADRLTDLLTRETALVGAMRIQEIGPLQPEKQRLTREYQHRLKELAALTAPLPPAAKSRAMRAGQRLAEAAVANERVLRVGQAATDRLIGAIATAIRSQRPSIAGYTPRKSAPRSARVAGIAVDRRL